MSKIRVRLSIEENIWLAAEAAAKAKGVGTSEYFEAALRTAIDPFDVIERAAELVRGKFLDLAEISDQIQVIADAIIDQWRSDDEPTDEDS